MQLNGSHVQMVAPPLMKLIKVWDAAQSTLEVLPGINNKSYVIHGYYMMARNTAAEACTSVTLIWTDYFSGIAATYDTLELVPNQVNSATARMTSLNLVTMPGKPINFYSDAAPAHKLIVLYYSELKV